MHFTSQSPHRVMWVGATKNKKTFIGASVLDRLKSGSFVVEVRTDAMVDVHGYVFIIPIVRAERPGLSVYIYIITWALHIACLTSTGTCQSLSRWDKQ